MPSVQTRAILLWEICRNLIIQRYHCNVFFFAMTSHSGSHRRHLGLVLNRQCRKHQRSKHLAIPAKQWKIQFLQNKNIWSWIFHIFDLYFIKQSMYLKTGVYCDQYSPFQASRWLWRWWRWPGWSVMWKRARGRSWQSEQEGENVCTLYSWDQGGDWRNKRGSNKSGALVSLSFDKLLPYDCRNLLWYLPCNYVQN